MDDYQYQSLDTKAPAFRLLKLRKGNTVSIECEMFHAVVSDEDTIHYEALSYTWGSTELVESITVDGKKLWITENLHSALHCLRLRDRDRILWTDAICINQSDRKEQSQQVLQMGKIFGCAKCVIFWLGKPTFEATLLMKTLAGLEARSIASSDEGFTTKSMYWKILWSKTQQLQDGEWLLRLRKGLETLLKRPWFDRVWILQEIMNAQSAIVCTGEMFVSANIFAISPSLVDVKPNQHIQSVLDLMPRLASFEPQYRRERDNLVDLLLKYRGSKATDKRDMIYALLGMSLEPFDHELLRPDYTKPLQEVVYNTLQYWFEATAVPVSQIINVLADFKTLRVTCLAVPDSTTTAGEILSLPNQLGIISCIRDPEHFVIEHIEEDVAKKHDSLYAEVDTIRLRLSKDEVWLNTDPYNIHELQYSSDVVDVLRMREREAELRKEFGDGLVDNDALEIVSCQNSNSEPTVKFLVIRKVKEAMLLVGLRRCKQLLRFIIKATITSYKSALDDAFVMAVEKENLNLVRLLLEEGADVNARENIVGYRSTLIMAAFRGNVEIAQLLLEKGADVNAHAGGFYDTALIAASCRWNLDMVQLLINYGADVNARGEGGVGSTALSTAARISGGGSIVRLLIENGANVHDGADGKDTGLGKYQDRGMQTGR